MRKCAEANHLGDSMPDVVVVGSGIAGLFVAVRCARAGLDTIVVTKKNLSDSSTNWAQGGIAAVLDPLDEEGLEAHVNDTIAAGCGLADEEVVRMVVNEAAGRIGDLIEAGVKFQHDEDGFDMAREGGHSNDRILHAKDATGAEIERALIAEARASPHLELLEAHMAIDLIIADRNADIRSIVGIWVLNPNGEVRTISTRAVIMATGGAGQLWRQTTNPNVATGDGIAMAHRAGAVVSDLEFVQFHPTALAVPGERPFLITEAVRGHGAVLMTERDLAAWKIVDDATTDPAQFSFMLSADPRGSLATRDIVARAADEEMKRSGENHVWLVTEHLDTDEMSKRFPTVAARLARHGLRLGEHPLPVAPAAHYMVGGISVDKHGRAQQPTNSGDESLPTHSPGYDDVQYTGLYAIGEAARTGLHGANRLASNSLLEAVVYSQKCAKAVIADLTPKSGNLASDLPPWRAEGLQDMLEHAPLATDRAALQATMTDDVGIVKRDARLQRAQRRLAHLSDEVDRIWRSCLPSQEIIELRNMIHVASLVTSAALLRQENIGLHYNLDHE